jgi:hypothetical protein
MAMNTVHEEKKTLYVLRGPDDGPIARYVEFSAGWSQWWYGDLKYAAKYSDQSSIKNLPPEGKNWRVVPVQITTTIQELQP